MNIKMRHSVKLVLFAQLRILFVLMMAGYFWGGPKTLTSVLLSGLVAIVPVILFSFVHFYYEGARQAKKIASNFYKGEALKLTTTWILFMLVFAFYRVEPGIFFISYTLIILIPWFYGMIREYK